MTQVEAGVRSDDVVVELERLVMAPNPEGIVRWLLAATVEDTAAARQWYRRGGRKWVEAYFSSEDWYARERAAYAADHGHRSEHWGVSPLLTLGLAAPAEAARRTDWVQLSLWLYDGDANLLSDLVRSRGADWAAAFVTTAGGLRHGQPQFTRGDDDIYRICRELIVAFELPFPDGAVVACGWAAAMAWDVDAATVLEADRSNPLMPTLLHRALEAGVMGRTPLASIAVEVILGLLDAGVVERQPLVRQVRDLLTAPQRTGTQRVLAKLVGALNMTRDELPGSAVALTGLIASSHGSVGAVLLPFALDAIESGDDLVELGATLAARPEKKQREMFVRAVLTDDLRRRAGDAAAIEALRTLRVAETVDARFRARLDTALAQLGDAAAEDVIDEDRGSHGLWDDLPQPQVAYTATRIGEWPRLTPELLAWFPMLSEPHFGLRLRQDLAVAAFVRDAWERGADATRADLRESFGSRRDHTTLNDAVNDALGVSQSGMGWQRAFELAGVYRRDGQHTASPFALSFPVSAFCYLRIREAERRLGTTPCLLSTPSHDDGTISLEALVPRLELNRDAGFGPLDLFQTLLRLRPVAPDELGALDELRVPLDSRVVPDGRPCLIDDAVDAVRAWVLGGGLPVAERPIATDIWSQKPPEVTLPLAADRFGITIPELMPALLGYQRDRAMAPRWVDLNLGLRDRLLASEEPHSDVAYDRLLRQLVDEQPENREQAGTIVVELIARDSIDVQRLVRVAKALFQAGYLSLTRLARSCDQLALSRGLRVAWAVALDVAADACNRKRTPAGLADLLTFLTTYGREVPAVALPEAIRAFADRRGSTKAQYQARELAASIGAVA